MVIYVKNNFNARDNNKYLLILCRLKHSIYSIRLLPGKTSEPIELPGLDDEIEISIAPESPMLECTKPSRVTYDDCLNSHLEITPPSLLLDYPYSVEVKDNMRKVSLVPGRHDWKVTLTNPLKTIDEWSPGLDPDSIPEKLNIVVGEDIDL